MSGDESRIEHHYHAPTTGQVVKAVRQYLADELPQAKLQELIDARIREAVAARVNAYLDGDRFDRTVCAAVAHVVAGKRESYRNTSRGLPDHFRYLIEQELVRTLVSGFTVKVEAKKTDG